MNENSFIVNHISAVNEKIKHIKKDWGIFFTPLWVVDFMIGLLDEGILHEKDIKLLEPACGTCQFLMRLKENKLHVFSNATVKIGVDINNKLIKYIYKNNFAQDVHIINEDYLLWDTKEKFDIIIGNPPYGIPSLSKHYTIRIDDKIKKKYKSIYETWYGKYNVYGAFIEKSINLLKDNGQLIFIVPATFMILDEFKKLRRFLSIQGETQIVYMGNDIFKPEADVTTVVLKFIKSRSRRNRLILYDYNNGDIKVITKNDRWTGNIILFSTEFSRYVSSFALL